MLDLIVVCSESGCYGLACQERCGECKTCTTPEDCVSKNPT